MPNDQTQSSARLGGALLSAKTAQSLVDALRGGAYPDDRLPPEVELAQRMGVSRTVIRDALSELERNGYIERVRGIGTVVNRGVVMLDSRMDRKLEFNRMIRDAGRTPRSDELSVTKENASPEMAAALGLAPGAPHTLLYVRRRLLADDTPVLHTTDVLPLALFGTQRVDRIDFTRPIFDIAAEYCGVEVTKTVAHLKAVAGTAALRRRLAVGREAALLQLDELCYSRLCRPVIYSRTFYTDFFDFAIVRTLF